MSLTVTTGPQISPRGSDIDHLRWMERHNWTQSIGNGKTVADLGCGSGHVCETFARAGARVIGLDLEPLPSGNPKGWTFLTGNLDKNHWPQAVRDAAQGKSLDLLLAFDIIEHLRSPIEFLEACFHLLANGGRLVLTTPNVNSWERLLRPHTWSGSRDPQHLVLFTGYSLKFLLRKAGFENVQITAPMRAIEPLPCWLKPSIGAQLLASATRI